MRPSIDPARRERRLFRGRLLFGIVLTLLLALLLLTRLIDLQVWRHAYYHELSAKNAIASEPIVPRRGLIFDRHGTVLAENATAYDLEVTPGRVADMSALLTQLGQVIALTPKALHRFALRVKQQRKFMPVLLKSDLDSREVADFAIDSWRFPGATIKARSVRRYPYGAAFAHVVGYVGRINDSDLKRIDKANYAGMQFIGKTGIERYYEKLLRGRVGAKKMAVTASGRVQYPVGTESPQAGANLYLTLDAGFQLAVTKIMAPYDGAAVVIRTDTGGVLAMVSTPSFDPNLFVQGISATQYRQLVQNPDKPLLDRPVHGLYAPGSTVKPFIALGALSDDVITPQYTIDDKGYYRLPHSKHIYRDWKIGGHGIVNVTKAIVVSCDTFFYNLGHKMGIKKIDAILGAFGFGKSVDIDLPDESTGVLPSPQWKKAAYGQPWYAGDTVITAIGQGYMLVTPLALAAYVATMANRGIARRSHLLYATTHNGNMQYTQPRSEEPPVAATAQAWQVVRQAMHDVIAKTGRNWGFGIPENYTAAGKTGTAQVTSHYFHGDYADVPLKLRPHSWMTVFAPYPNAQIAVAVLIEHTPASAAPVTRKIVDYFFAHERQILAGDRTDAASEPVNKRPAAQGATHDS